MRLHLDYVTTNRHIYLAILTLNRQKQITLSSLSFRGSNEKIETNFMFMNPVS